LIVIVLLATVPPIVLGFAFIIAQDFFNLKKELVNKTKLDADLVGVACIAPLIFTSKEGVEEVVNKFQAIPRIKRGYVFDDEGKLYASYHKKKDTESLPPPIPPIDKDDFYMFESGRLKVIRPIKYNNKKIGKIFLIVSTEQLARETQNQISSLLLATIGLIVLSYLLTLRFQGLISHPILVLARVMKRISNKSDYSIRIKKEGKDEVGILYDGFNNMLEQIQFWESKRDKAEKEQQRLLEELEEKNHELEQVIYVTSHDLRAPLVNLQGFSQELGFSLKELLKLLEQAPEFPENISRKIEKLANDEIFDSLKYIQSSTYRMDVLLSGLLQLSRVSRMELISEPVDMNKLMAEVISGFEFQIKEVGIKLHIGELPDCMGNKLQIAQIFSNLIDNALKYIDPSKPGEIKITGEEKEPEEKTPHHVLYCVEDNGIGISHEYHKKIFELFNRLHPNDTKGDGLGLTIVNKIVNRHHGRIWVESQPGSGSKFYVLLPGAIESTDSSFSAGSSESSGPIVNSSS